MFFLGQCLRNVFEYISLIDHQLNIFNVHFLVSNILKPESLLVKKFKVIVLLDAFFKIISSFKVSVVSTISLVNFISTDPNKPKNMDGCNYRFNTIPRYIRSRKNSLKTLCFYEFQNKVVLCDSFLLFLKGVLPRRLMTTLAWDVSINISYGKPFCFK